ncbi:ABC transporter [Nocardioides gansuensis]|uniref:ABC transporter n=1 Tax=Nocardioides gansuensis TaxID=2138300 RepID=A0A2T8FBK2_9ACTN|nr:ABC transporter permease [Nocardioides gansuensis]PVG83087.1 ABC transporter [Nocardioides gansuensis]
MGDLTRHRARDDAPMVSPSSTTGLVEVFRRRHLLGLLVRTTMKSRYQGTLLGWAWSYLQPAVRFCLFYFLFQVMIGRGAETTPNFAIHLFAGMVIIHFFTETFNGGTQSLVANRSLIIKLAMPKELFPVARMLVALWHTGPMMVILVIACVATGWRPDMVGLGAGLLGFAVTMSLGLAVGLTFAVANVYFRDFGKVAQTLTQFVTFSVPMMYPYTLVAERFGETGAHYYLFNPMAEAVLLIQRCFWTGSTDDPAATAAAHLPDDLWSRGFVMLGATLLLLLLAQLLFARLEKGVPERL